jgi:hypothetical protein
MLVIVLLVCAATAFDGGHTLVGSICMFLAVASIVPRGNGE